MASPGRTSGILLHPTSLPSPFGIGDLGPDAHRFAARLRDMAQSWWQMLPVGPTGYGDSPYQSPSTFAGNPLLVSPEGLVEEGLLRPGDLDRAPPFQAHVVDHASVIPWREGLLARAAAAFHRRRLHDDFGRFVDEHRPVWLDDFALYAALKRREGLRPWWEWEPDLVRRDPDAVAGARAALAGEIHQVEVEQFLFETQFRALRAACARSGVGIIGDLPVFVAHDSADVWANPDLFHLDEAGRPTVVAGVPPDYFSETGQRWGNPLYRWERHQEDGFAWWQQRLARAFSLFDLVRIDHFRGFAAYWEIPAGRETATEGRWVEAPGQAFFRAMQERFGPLPVIAEDLGVITPDVEELRDGVGLPGMRVAQFGFTPGSPHRPDRYPRQVVAYTATHDNDTTVGWWNDPARAEESREAARVLGLDRDGAAASTGSEVHWAMMAAVARSAADLVVVPLQDVLGLGSEARMNVPGVAGGNWRWRFRWEQLTDEVVERLRSLTEATGRARPRGG